jgi:hypothetical protein
VPISQYAYLYVESAEEHSIWEPDELTAAVNVQPSEVRRRGELNRRGRPTRRTSWRYSGEPTADDDTDLITRAVAEVVESHAEVFQAFVRDHALVAGINVVINMVSEKTFAGDGDQDVWGVPTPSVGLSASTVQLLARLGIGIELDLYVDLPEDVVEAAGGTT